MKRGTQTAALLLWALLLAFGWPAGVHAQGTTTAALSGTVNGPDGNAVAGASVTARNTATGVSRTVGTDPTGRYYIPNLQPGGPYTVTATRIGFSSATRQGVTLVLAQTTRVDLQLAEEAVTLEAVTATGATSPVIAPSRTGASTVIGAQTIESVPTITRNFADVAVLSPYVQVQGGGEAASIGGANNRFNNVQIDGAVSNDVFGLASSGVPGGQAGAKPVPLDAIAQFQVLVAPYDVRQSGFTGGLINAVTKSGTNEFRGTAFGFLRNDALVQNRITAGRDTLRRPNDFLNRQFGFTLGGPIVRDRLHFFVAAELEQRREPTAFGIESDSTVIRVLPSRFEQVADAAEGYGIDIGNAAIYTPETDLGNLLARLDYRINDNHRVVLRHNYSPNSFDNNPARGGANFTYSSATYNITNRTNNTVAQLFSEFGGGVSNEFFVNFQRVRDNRDPVADYALTEVNTRDLFDNGQTISGRLVFGAERSSQANELDQDGFEVTNNLTLRARDHTFTLGATGIYNKFRNLFVQTSMGYWRFPSPDAFDNDSADTYEIALPVSGLNSLDETAARFSVFQLGGYFQDEWQARDNLTLTFGLRADVPYTLDEPRDNPVFQEAFGKSTTDVPSGNPLFSPRFGFNWQLGDEAVTQIRGGVGVFSGRLPFVWLSNAFGNTGRETVLLTCTNTNTVIRVPEYDPFNPPTQCADGSGAANAPATVNIFTDDFTYPQDLKLSLAVDRELPFGFTGTLEGLYTKAVNQIYIEELNLTGPQTVPATATQGLGDREIYGTPIGGNASRDSAFFAQREDTRFRNVLRVDNINRGYSYAVTGELQKAFGRSFDMRAAYTYSRSYDVVSFTSSVASSNFGFAPAGKSIYDRPLTPSAFDRPHKFLVYGAWRGLPQYGGTELSATYVGQSGRTYTYTYDGDVNGDGYSGPGGVSGRNNDIVYVPRNASEVNFSTPEDQRLFLELVEKEECLRESKGQIMERNSCRAPWVNRVDVHVAQGLPGRYLSNLKFEANIFNFANLLNDDWGLQRGPSNNTVTLLDLNGRTGGNSATGAPVFTYDLPGFTENDAGGVARAGRPYTTFFESRYQIQLGLRYEF